MSYDIQNEDSDVSIFQIKTNEQLLGLIGAVMDRMVVRFDYRGLKVRKEGGSMVVEDPETGDDLGGRLHLEGADLRETAVWIDNKAELYGDN